MSFDHFSYMNKKSRDDKMAHYSNRCNTAVIMCSLGFQACLKIHVEIGTYNFNKVDDIKKTTYTHAYILPQTLSHTCKHLHYIYRA